MINISVPILVIFSIIAIIILTSRLKMHAFAALFLVSILLAVTTLPPDKIMSVIRDGFGTTMGSIGLLIILGAIIGVTLDRTGGMISIANYILSKTGTRRSAEAIGLTGFLTGMPIFCDSGFIILSGLAKSFRSKSGVALPFIATVLACSLYSVHCLIPPHPGALAAAGMLDVNVGYLIVTGIFFAIPGALSAYYWSRWVSRKVSVVDKEVHADTDELKRDLPPVFLSFLPIVVPLILITVKSLISLVDRDSISLISKIFNIPGEPVIALSAGAVLAMLLVKDKSVSSINSVISESVLKAGPILIITASGGMFGMVIRSTGIGETLGSMLSGTSAGIIVPFIIAFLMKTAQGSSTVAIITSASFVAPMLPMLGLDTESGRLFATLSMGAGSMMISHANDSYFWVVNNFGELDINTTLKVYSTSTMIMGIVVFAFIWTVSLFVL
ncbi:MAG: GntP family permease [Bacteroidales bacterium]|nr:GntP family permease [Bacteroidales bacterium]